MAELAQLLSSIEDWESYQVVTPVVSDESDKTIEEGPSVASIKENLSDALSFKLDSEVDPNRLPQLKKLHRVFSVWRQTLDDKEEQVPHLLIYRLDEDYGDVEVESLYASLLKGTDRILLCQVAPVAKAYGFNLHFGEAKYMESGYPKTTPRNDSETQNSRENGMDVDSDDDSRSEESFVELEEMDYELDMNDQCFSVENVTKMNGFPLEMKSVELEKLGGYEAREESRRLIINGDVTDRKPRSEFEDYMEPYDRLHVLNQTWSSRCLLISPNDTNEVAFSPSNEVVAYACTLLSISHSTIPTAKESEIINSAIEWLSKNPPLGNLFKWKRLTSVLCSCAIRWNDKKLFVDVLRFCGERKVIGTIVGVEPLVAGCQVFQWSEINNWYDQAMSNSSSFRFRYELVKQILASTTDDNIMVWGSSKISTFVDDLGKVEVNDIEAVVSWLRSQRHPIHILRDQLTPRLSAQQSDDMEVWAALFSRLHDGPDGSNFDKAELLSVIQDTLRHMADTVDPLRSHVVSLVELCARYEVMAALDSVFRRMWGDSRQNSWPDLLWQLNTTLISGFEGLAEKDPRMKKFLTRVFFGQAFEYLLSNYSGNNKSSLKKIAKYLDDPVDNLLKYATPERVKVASKTKRCSLVLDDLMSLIRSYMGQAKDSGHVLAAQLQNIHRLCFEERIASTDYSSLTQETSSEYSTVINLLNLCMKAGYPDEVPRVLEKCLNAPECKRPEYAMHGLYNVIRGLPKFLKRHGILVSSAEVSDSRIAPYIHFANETVKRILSRPEGLSLDLCGEVARNPLLSSITRTGLQEAVQKRIRDTGPNLGVSPQDLKEVGCGCSDCNQFLVPIFVQNRGLKVGISVKGKDAANKHFEERLERTRSWGVTWQLKRGKLQISRPPGLINQPQWLPRIQEAKKMVEALGLPQALSADYAWMTEALSPANAGQKRPIDVDDDVANKRARTA